MLSKLVKRHDPSSFVPMVVSLGDAGPLGEDLKANGIPVEALGMRRGRPSLAALFHFRKILRQFRPGLIQSWMYHANLFSLVGTGFGRNAPLVWGIHHTNLQFGVDKPLTLLVGRACALGSHFGPARIVCCSNSTRRVHQSCGYAASRMLVIPNGFEIEIDGPNPETHSPLHAELGLPREARLVAHVGRFHPQKDHETFFRAAAIVARDYSDVHFVLCGAGVTWDNPEIVRMVEQAGVRGCVHLLGIRRDVAEILKASFLLASSSCSEAAPMVIGEAMSCGRPCVVTNVGDCAEIVGESGFVVSPKEPASLAAAIAKLLSASAEEIVRLGTAARQRIHENFELDAVVGKYEALYKAVVQDWRAVAQPTARR
jgi:glycosyltransferase involved in cell wall biosynthesis